MKTFTIDAGGYAETDKQAGARSNPLTNIDYNRIGEGTTLILPVFHPGALFFLGDGHALQADGESIGTGIETTMEVTFTVALRKKANLSGPHLETADKSRVDGERGTLRAKLFAHANEPTGSRGDERAPDFLSDDAERADARAQASKRRCFEGGGDWPVGRRVANDPAERAGHTRETRGSGGGVFEFRRARGVARSRSWRLSISATRSRRRRTSLLTNNAKGNCCFRAAYAVGPKYVSGVQAQNGLPSLRSVLEGDLTVDKFPERFGFRCRRSRRFRPASCRGSRRRRRWWCGRAVQRRNGRGRPHSSPCNRSSRSSRRCT